MRWPAVAWVLAALLWAGSALSASPEQQCYSGLLDRARVIDLCLDQEAGGLSGRFVLDGQPLASAGNAAELAGERRAGTLVLREQQAPRGSAMGFKLESSHPGMLEGSYGYEGAAQRGKALLVRHSRPPAQASIAWAGEWRRVAPAGAPATLALEPARVKEAGAGESYRFRLESLTGASRGSLAGLAHLRPAGTLVYQPDDSPCRLRFLPAPEQRLLVLADAGCATTGGLNLLWSGIFTRAE